MLHILIDNGSLCKLKDILSPRTAECFAVFRHFKKKPSYCGDFCGEMKRNISWRALQSGELCDFHLPSKSFFSKTESEGKSQYLSPFFGIVWYLRMPLCQSSSTLLFRRRNQFFSQFSLSKFNCFRFHTRTNTLFSLNPGTSIWFLTRYQFFFWIIFWSNFFWEKIIYSLQKMRVKKYFSRANHCVKSISERTSRSKNCQWKRSCR